MPHCWKSHGVAHMFSPVYSKTCLKWPLLKTPKKGFQDQLWLNAGQKYWRMLQGEHSAILSTCIELPHGFKTFVLSIFEWPLKTGFTVIHRNFNEPTGTSPLHKPMTLSCWTTLAITVTIPRGRGLKKRENCLTHKIQNWSISLEQVQWNHNLPLDAVWLFQKCKKHKSMITV